MFRPTSGPTLILPKKLRKKVIAQLCRLFLRVKVHKLNLGTLTGSWRGKVILCPLDHLLANILFRIWVRCCSKESPKYKCLEQNRGILFFHIPYLEGGGCVEELTQWSQLSPMCSSAKCFGLRTPLHSKIIEDPREICLCGWYLLIFTVFKNRTENYQSICLLISFSNNYKPTEC